MKVLFLFIFIINYQAGIAQNSNEEIYSSEEQAYYKTKHYKEFKPTDSSTLVSFSAFAVKIQPMQDFTPFTDVNSISKMDSGKSRTAGHLDMLKIMNDTNEIGIWNNFIIKTGEDETVKAILYKDGKYDRSDRGEMGIWIAICNKKNNNWRKYFTGLAANTPIYLKWNSKFPLIKNEHTLQIEAAFVQRLDVYSDPVTMGKYKLIKDGIIIDFELDKIMQDSDGDGLTDIEERKMMLNPNNADTDGDGIPDAVDANPRFNLPRNDTTLLYESIINQAFGRYGKGPKILVDTFGAKLGERFETILIVSDGPNIQSVQHCRNRLVILTEKEYECQHLTFPNGFTKYSLSPLFKVDGKPNTYKLQLYGPFWSYILLIEKKDNSWFITVAAFMIS